jgi:disulfide bond formation protein DsbB
MSIDPSPLDRSFVALFLAWLVALSATLGALFVGEVLGQTPCLLCWYQRIAMFPLALILGIACLRDDGGIRIYAMPAALAGAAIATWHSLVYFDVAPAGIAPCGQGPSCQGADMTLFGSLPLPVLSLGAFAAILLLLSIGRRSPEQ